MEESALRGGRVAVSHPRRCSCRGEGDKKDPVKSIFVLGVLLVTSAVSAQERDGEIPHQELSLESAADGSSLPLTLNAAQPYAAVVTGFTGYDTARETALVDVAAQVRVWGPLSLRGGA